MLLAGSLEDIKQFIKDNPSSLDEKDVGGMTPLIIASIENRLDVVEHLLDLKVEIDAMDSHRTTALRYSVGLGRMSIIELLIQRGADFKTPASDKLHSPMESAALLGRINVAKYLISKGATLCADDGREFSPLTYAVAMDQLEFLKWGFANSNGYFRTKEDSIRHLLLMATQSNALRCLKWLISECEDVLNWNIDIGTLQLPDGKNLVQQAAESGSLSILQWLISERCFSPTLVTPQSKNPAIWHAAANGKSECLSYLYSCSHPSTINYSSDEGDTPLIMAAYHNHAKVVRLLLGWGCDPSAPSKKGLTAIMCAARKGNLEIVQMLLDAGAEISVNPETGISALSEAIQRSKLEAALLIYRVPSDQAEKARTALTKMGSENIFHLAASEGLLELMKEIRRDYPQLVFAKEGLGRTALDMALCFGNIETVQYLLELGFTPEKHMDPRTMTEAALKGRIEAVKWMAENGAEIEWTNAEENTFPGLRKPMQPLYGAVCKGHLEVARYLIQQGANVRHPTHEFETTLFAAISGNVELFQLLIDHGAKVDALNEKSQTVLHMAASIKPIEMLTYLLKNFKDQVDVNAVCAEGSTALGVAVLNGNLEAAKMLIEAGADLERAKEPLPISATRSTSTKVLQFIMDQGLSIHVTDSAGHNSLAYAVHGGSNDVVDLIVTKLDPNTLDSHETCSKLIVLAIQSNKLATIRRLFERYGIGKTLKPSWIESDLPTYCIRHLKSEILEWVLFVGVPEYMQHAHPNIQQILYSAMQQGKLAIIKRLLRAGISLISPTYKPYMHYACSSGSLPTVQWLISRLGTEGLYAPNISGVPAYSCAPAGSELQKWLKEQELIP